VREPFQRGVCELRPFAWDCATAAMPGSSRGARTWSLTASARVEAELTALGWDVLTLWECETEDFDAMKERLAKHVRG